MAGRKPQWSELGDLAIATLEMVAEYGAYAKLDEYAKPEFLLVSEVFSSLAINNCDFNRENQVVLKPQNMVSSVSKAGGLGTLRREK